MIIFFLAKYDIYVFKGKAELATKKFARGVDKPEIASGLGMDKVLLSIAVPSNEVLKTPPSLCLP